jgi:hypothetical protein
MRNFGITSNWHGRWVLGVKRAGIQPTMQAEGKGELWQSEPLGRPKPRTNECRALLWRGGLVSQLRGGPGVQGEEEVEIRGLLQLKR